MPQLLPYNGTDFYLWKYLPSLPAAIIFLLLFTGFTGALVWRLVQTRAWFCIVFAFGGLCQVIGYATRTYCYYHTEQLAPYAIQSCFIVLAPIFYAASIYMVLGRLIISVHGERFSIIRATRLTKIFVLSDILALNIQGNGAGLTINHNTQKIGEYIVIAGLFFQLIVFGLFVYVALVFNRRMQRDLTKESESRIAVPWRQGLKMLYICSALIIVRSIFRIVEYMMGTDGYLLSNEWAMYVFDAVPMWVVQVAFFVWFPDKFQAKRIDGDEDGHILEPTSPQ